MGREQSQSSMSRSADMLLCLTILHFFARGDQNLVLGNWVKGLKRAILKAFLNEKDHSLWQPGFFDHLLRNDESYAQKWEYVRENPVRAGLVHCSRLALSGRDRLYRPRVASRGACPHVQARALELCS